MNAPSPVAKAYVEIANKLFPLVGLATSIAVFVDLGLGVVIFFLCWYLQNLVD